LHSQAVSKPVIIKFAFPVLKKLLSELSVGGAGGGQSELFVASRAFAHAINTLDHAALRAFQSGLSAAESTRLEALLAERKS
jgi:hypothetical protein